MLRELRIKIMEMLQVVPNMDKDTTIGIVAPLKTEEQANQMIEYLNTLDLKTTKTSPLICKALEISGIKF